MNTKYTPSAKKYSDYIIMEEDARLKGYSLIHGFLALLVANHESTYHPSVGHAIGDALDSLFLNQNMSYDRLKENPDMIAQFVINHVSKEIPIADEEKLKQAIERGLPKIFKIIDKMWPEPNHPNLKIIGKALHEVDDPVGILKRNGIDIEPELEEFRQFLAEISGKKINEKPKSQTIPPEVLAIMMGLKFAGYSEEALKKAEGEIIHRLDALIEQDIEKNALKIAYYSALLRLIQKKELKRRGRSQREEGEFFPPRHLPQEI
ncbi:hypothetical protein [Thermococcus paralvinellae]|uniref:Uncharacterized protein n=1 Tax=Thermococcus paralvinellae TaxID=582419 RepID=W0I571_9EURY|nr:hypothetical protein [Thermococcus paralvinellae]AHF79585.1 Hypothetical protein TES1_0188 [Thermococcus paralvinellae]